MKITLVCPFDPMPTQTGNAAGHVGGVERVFAELADRLARRGHQVTLLCSTDDAPGEWLDRDLRVRRVRRFGTLFRTPLVRLASHIPPDSDIVHVAATYPFTTASVLKRAKAMNIPAILDFHFEPKPEGALGEIAGDLYRRIGPPHYPLATRTLLRSIAYGRRAPSLRGVPRDTWRVVPNGIDPDRFTHEGPVHEEDADYLLFVGRLVPYKGLSVLLDAMAQADIQTPLLIVGDGPLRKDLEAQAERLGLQVRFLGHVADADLPSYYRGARLTVLPSVNHQEAFGITLIESMACGTPVVASALPGVRQVAEFGGWTARPGDASDLARVLEEAMQPDALERGAGLASRTHAAFSWDAVADTVLSVYAEAVGDAAPPAERTEQVEVRPIADPGGHAVLRA